MRELTLLETSCLAGMLLLSLVLPLMMSLRAPRAAAVRRSRLKTVWTGQTLLAAGGLAVLLSAGAAFYATVLGAAGCVGCAFLLRQQLRVAPTV
jgi:hypothetical protein